MAIEKVQVPDIGGAEEVEVIEILVKPGDQVKENDSLAVLETDKAAVEIPSPQSGVIKEVLVSLGDKVSQGSDLISMEGDAGGAAETSSDEAAPEKPQTEQQAAPAESTSSDSPVAAGSPQEQQGAAPAESTSDLSAVAESSPEQQAVTESASDSPATAESSPPASSPERMDLPPAPDRGQSSSGEAAEPPAANIPAAETPEAETSMAAPGVSPKVESGDEVYAGPAVRKLARELGVQLSEVKGSGEKGRILKDDVQEFVKVRMQSPSAPPSGAPVPAEDVDFSRFGQVEEIDMSSIQLATARHTASNWAAIPHVTQFDEADITDLEDFRAVQKSRAEQKGLKLTLLPFIVRACAQALRECPQFNVSLHSSGRRLIQKKYQHIGVAMATPAGLVVPVIRDVNSKSIWDIAAEIQELRGRAMERRLGRADMEGGCFSVSSLGNIGGTGFTPIVNAPEVAILGVSKTCVKPVYRDGGFIPRTFLPFSLSYDHRAVNGVDGGQFCTYLGTVLNDIRLLTL